MRDELLSTAPIAVSIALLLTSAGAPAGVQPDKRPGRPAREMTLLKADLTLEAVRVTRLEVITDSASGDLSGGVWTVDASGTERRVDLAEVVAVVPPNWLDAGGAIPAPVGQKREPVAPKGAARETPVEAAKGGAGAASIRQGLAPPSLSGPNDRAVMKVRQPAAAIPVVPSTIELVDGQRLVGALRASSDGPPDTVLWQNRAIGKVVLPLDRVRRLDLPLPTIIPGAVATDDSQGSGPRATTDRVRLKNGDAVSGFVESIGPSVVVKPEGGSPVSLPVVGVSGIDLSNDTVPATGCRLWLRDGSVLAISGLTQQNDAKKYEVRLATIGGDEGPVSSMIDAAEIRAMAPSAGSVVSLTSLAFPTVENADSPVADPVIVGSVPFAPLCTGDVFLPEPMTVTWEIPAGATRIAGAAELPESCRDWGNCRLIASVIGPGAAGADDGRVLFDEALSELNQVVTFNVPLDNVATVPGARIRFRVDAAEFGPIQDRIVLRAVVFKVESGAAR